MSSVSETRSTDNLVRANNARFATNVVEGQRVPVNPPAVRSSPAATETTFLALLGTTFPRVPRPRFISAENLNRAGPVEVEVPLNQNPRQQQTAVTLFSRFIRANLETGTGQTNATAMPARDANHVGFSGLRHVPIGFRDAFRGTDDIATAMANLENRTRAREDAEKEIIDSSPPNYDTAVDDVKTYPTLPPIKRHRSEELERQVPGQAKGKRSLPDLRLIKSSFTKVSSWEGTTDPDIVIQLLHMHPELECVYMAPTLPQSDPNYSPYVMQMVSPGSVDVMNYCVVGRRFAVRYIRGKQPHRMSTRRWAFEQKITFKLRKIPFFKNFRILKAFTGLASHLDMRAFGKTQRKLRSTLNCCDPIFAEALLLVRTMCLDMSCLSMIQVDKDLTYTLNEFMEDQEHFTQDAAGKIERYHLMLLQLTSRTCWDDVISAGLAVEREERKNSAPKRINELRKMQRIKQSTMIGSNQRNLDDILIGSWVTSDDEKESLELSQRKAERCERLSRLIYQIDCIVREAFHELYVASLSLAVDYINLQVQTFPSDDEIRALVRGYIGDLDLSAMLTGDDDDDDDDNKRKDGQGRKSDKDDPQNSSKGGSRGGGRRRRAGPRSSGRSPSDSHSVGLNDKNAKTPAQPGATSTTHTTTGSHFDGGFTSTIASATFGSSSGAAFFSDPGGFGSSSTLSNELLGEVANGNEADQYGNDSLDSTTSTSSDEENANSMGNVLDFSPFIELEHFFDNQGTDPVDRDAPMITAQMGTLRIPNEATYDVLFGNGRYPWPTTLETENEVTVIERLKDNTRYFDSSAEFEKNSTLDCDESLEHSEMLTITSDENSSLNEKLSQNKVNQLHSETRMNTDSKATLNISSNILSRKVTNSPDASIYSSATLQNSSEDQKPEQSNVRLVLKEDNRNLQNHAIFSSRSQQTKLETPRVLSQKSPVPGAIHLHVKSIFKGPDKGRKWRTFLLKEKIKKNHVVYPSVSQEEVLYASTADEGPKCSSSRTKSLLAESHLTGIFHSLFSQVVESSVDVADYPDLENTVLDFPILDGTVWDSDNIENYMNIRSNKGSSVDGVEGSILEQVVSDISSKTNTESSTAGAKNVFGNMKQSQASAVSNDSSQSSHANDAKKCPLFDTKDNSSTCSQNTCQNKANSRSSGPPSKVNQKEQGESSNTSQSPAQQAGSPAELHQSQTGQNVSDEATAKDVVSVVEFLGDDDEAMSNPPASPDHANEQPLYTTVFFDESDIDDYIDTDTAVTQDSRSPSYPDLSIKGGNLLYNNGSNAAPGTRKDGGKRKKGGKPATIDVTPTVQDKTPDRLQRPKDNKRDNLEELSAASSNSHDNSSSETKRSKSPSFASAKMTPETSSGAKNLQELNSFFHNTLPSLFQQPKKQAPEQASESSQEDRFQSPIIGQGQEPPYNSERSSFGISQLGSSHTTIDDDITSDYGGELHQEFELLHKISALAEETESQNESQPVDDDTENDLTNEVFGMSTVNETVSPTGSVVARKSKEIPGGAALNGQEREENKENESDDIARTSGSSGHGGGKDGGSGGGGGGGGGSGGKASPPKNEKKRPLPNLKPMFHSALSVERDEACLTPDVYDFTATAFNMIHDMEEQLLVQETLSANPAFLPFMKPAVRGYDSVDKIMRGPSLDLILRRDSKLVFLKNAVYESIDIMFHYADVYCSEMERLNRKYFREKGKGGGDIETRGVVEFCRLLQAHNTQLKIIERLPDSQRLGMFLIDVAPFKEHIHLYSSASLQKLHQDINRSAVQRTHNLIAKCDHIQRTLEGNPTTTDALFKRLTTMDSLPKIMHEIENGEVIEIASLYEIMDRFDVPQFEAERQAFESSHYLIAAVHQAGELSLTEREEVVNNIETCLERDISWIESQARKVLKPLVELSIFLDGTTDGLLIKEALTETEGQVRSYVAKANFVRTVQRYLEKEESQFKELFEVSSRYVNTRNLWLLMADWDSKLESWKHQSFDALDIQKINNYTFKYMEALDKLDNVLPKNTVVQVFGEKMDIMLRWLNFIIEFRGQAVKPRHWRQIEEVLGVQFGDELPFTLASLMSVNAIEKQKNLHVILNRARAESNVQNEFDEVRNQCRNMSVPIHARQKALVDGEDPVTVYLMGDSFEIEESLNYCVMELERIDLSPHAGFLHDNLEELVQQIFETLENLVQWSEMQMKLSRLRRLIMRHPELSTSQAAEVANYRQIFIAYSTFMRDVRQDPNVMTWCSSQALQDIIEVQHDEIIRIYRVLKREVDNRGGQENTPPQIGPWVIM